MLTLLMLASYLGSGFGSRAFVITLPKSGAMIATGYIDQGFSGRVKRSLEKNPHARYLEIDSPEGVPDQAYKAAEVLNQHDMEIRIRGRCAGACVLLWASVRKRTLLDGAKIGFPGGSPVRAPAVMVQNAASARKLDRAIGVLTDAGFSAPLVSRVQSTGPNSTLWLSPADLESEGVEFNRLSSPVPPADGTPDNSSTPTPLHGAA